MDDQAGKLRLMLIRCSGVILKITEQTCGGRKVVEKWGKTYIHFSNFFKRYIIMEGAKVHVGPSKKKVLFGYLKPQNAKGDIYNEKELWKTILDVSSAGADHRHI